jgi:hypothetical protein
VVLSGGVGHRIPPDRSDGGLLPIFDETVTKRHRLIYIE